MLDLGKATFTKAARTMNHIHKIKMMKMAKRAVSFKKKNKIQRASYTNDFKPILHEAL